MRCQIVTDRGSGWNRNHRNQKSRVVRLRRIEGQVRGVQRMVDEERDCPDILQQMAAIRSAMHQASLVLARAYAARCLRRTGRAAIRTRAR